VPVRLLQTPCAGVFEKLVNRCEQHARALHVEPQIEIELVVEEMNIAAGRSGPLVSDVALVASAFFLVYIWFDIVSFGAWLLYRASAEKGT
jgi:hypothetical protein